MDWYPTLLEICDLPKPKVKFDGHSIVPILKSAEAKSKHDVLHFQWQQKWYVREGDWKLIQHNNRVGADGRFSLVNPTDDKPAHRENSNNNTANPAPPAHTPAAAAQQQPGAY